MYFIVRGIGVGSTCLHLIIEYPHLCMYDKATLLKILEELALMHGNLIPLTALSSRLEKSNLPVRRSPLLLLKVTKDSFFRKILHKLNE